MSKKGNQQQKIQVVRGWLVNRQDITPAQRHEIVVRYRKLIEKQRAIDPAFNVAPILVLDDVILGFSTEAEMIKTYTWLARWLHNHEAQPGTENRKDIHGRPYDPDKYERVLELLEATNSLMQKCGIEIPKNQELLEDEEKNRKVQTLTDLFGKKPIYIDRNGVRPVTARQAMGLFSIPRHN